MVKPRLISGPTGPYEHGYLVCRVQYPDGYRIITWQKYIYESAYGVLPKGYIVHHKDENKSNNDLSNLEPKTRSEHARKHSSVGEILVKLICLECNKQFERRPSDIRKYNNFCGKSCAGKYSRRNQPSNLKCLPL